jgi:hypothetical protein
VIRFLFNYLLFSIILIQDFHVGVSDHKCISIHLSITHNKKLIVNFSYEISRQNTCTINLAFSIARAKCGSNNHRDCVLCTVYWRLCTVYCLLCTVYWRLCTVYCVLETVYCVLCTVYWRLCTVYWRLFMCGWMRHYSV